MGGGTAPFFGVVLSFLSSSAGVPAGAEFAPPAPEAVHHNPSAAGTGPTVTAVLRRGYRFGERLLRPALVAVTDHEPANAE